MMLHRISIGLRQTSSKLNCSSACRRPIFPTSSRCVPQQLRLFSNETKTSPVAPKVTAPPKSRNAMPITWTSLAVTGVVGLGLLYFYESEKERRQQEVVSRNTSQVGKPALGGQWTLVDHNGRAVTDASLLEDGHTHSLLYFGFTFCPDICPAELIKMQEAIEILDNDEEVGPVVRPVFITVDPKRDGVAQVAHYVKDFHPRMLGLTGTPEQIQVACRAFRVYHSIADQDLEDEDEYLVDHSIVMYLIGPDGRFVDFYTQLTEADEAAARMKKAILEWRAEEKQEAV